MRTTTASILLCVCHVACLAYVGATEEESISPRVGVIGGGAAGLTTAYLLQQKGYQVTVLEKADQVGGFATTKRVNGKPYDMATMFIPGGSIAGDGIEPTLQELIDVSKEKIIPAVGFYTLDTNDLFLDFIPEILAEYDPSDIVNQLLQGLVYSTQLISCLLDSANCVGCDVCSTATEPLASWGDTWGVPAYAKLSQYTFDGLGAGPTAFGATFLSTLSPFAAVDVAELLRNLGVTSDTLPPGMPPNIVSLLSSVRWYFFDKGYQTFWINFVKQANLNVLTNLAVESLENDENLWKIHGSDGGLYEFEQVIVTSAPQDALSFLPDGPQKNLIATGVPQVPPNDVFIVPIAEDTNPADNDVDNDVVAFWPTGFGLGTQSLVDPGSGGIVKPFFYQSRHDRDYYVVATYTLSDALSIDEVFDAVKTYSEETLGLSIQGEYLHHERYLFPSGPSDRAAWTAAWATLQGTDGLWFNGEAFSNSGIPAITQYTKRFVDQAFADIN